MKQKKNSKAFGVRGAVCRAFTLAEVLITIGIIGVVAALTIPSLMQNINNKQLTTATNNFNRRFGEALKIMNSQGTLAGRKTTQGFLDELSKVFNVARICDNTKLEQCFPKIITWGEKEVDTTTLTKSLNIVDDNHDWGTDVMGVRFANGVSGLIAYNPDCKQDSGNNNLIQVGGNEGSVGFSTNNCLAMLYDVSSNKKPNKVGQDIQQTSNVENLGGILVNINGVKITKIAQAGSYDPIDCTDITSEDYEKYCLGSSIYNDNYFAGAIKLCGGQENMATENDLLKIAQYFYNDDTIQNEEVEGLKLDSKKLKQLNLPTQFSAWSFGLFRENSCTGYRAFLSNSTFSSGTPNNLNRYITFCVKH